MCSMTRVYVLSIFCICRFVILIFGVRQHYVRGGYAKNEEKNEHSDHCSIAGHANDAGLDIYTNDACSG
ncbi:unknown protein [Paenibacillus amylolyticus]|uniref:Uncharacterized protein n=1 Tax=Paenibacillus amylolyticus TaxID=1451 RepID=A0A100VQ26_PAEAM|nr:unknown protein [Paenibacillus amylolyticus]